MSGVIYHEGEQSHCGHYTSGVKVDNTWSLISGTRILRQQKLQCSLKYISVPFRLIYERITKFLTTPSISLNGTAETSSTSELMTETAETMIRQSVLQELVKQKAKLYIILKEEKVDSSKVKSPVKRMSKFINCSCKENDKKRKKLMRDNVND